MPRADPAASVPLRRWPRPLPRRRSRTARARRSAPASSSSSPSAATRSSPAPASCPRATRRCCSRTPGMVQFKDALSGVEKRDYTRAVDYQRCLRVAGKHNDFEEVGRTPRHHTLFEMLGNWSFGDYFKRDAIHWAWQFLTRDLGIPEDRLAATVYTTDDVAHAVWKDEIGLPPERLVRWGDFPAGDEKNWWRMADVGPCGPCSELHYDRGAHLSEGPECVPDHSEQCPRWLEVWNLVFMEFELHPDRSLTPLPAPGVDTGMGLERVASVVQGVTSNYDTDLFAPIHARMRELLGHDPEGFEQERFSYQVIADHSRAVTFLVADGVLPSNEGRGYVLRRIMRRAIRHGRLLGRHEPFLGETAKVVIDTMADAYPHLAERRAEVLGVIEREERQFNRTLEAGVGILEEALIPLTDAERVVGRLAEAPARRRAGAARHGRVPAPRHVRLPDRPDRRARGRVRRAHGPRRVPGRARRAARAEPERDEGRAREDRRARVALQRAAGPHRPDRVPGLRDARRRGPRRRDPARRRRVRVARGGAGGGAARRGRGPRRARPRPDAVLRRVGRPGRRHGPDPRRGRLGPVRRRRRPAGRRHPDRRASPSIAACSTARSASGTSSGPRSTPSGAPTRCATTRARTCSTARCATSSATGRGRRARSCTRTTSGSTSRSTAR